MNISTVKGQNESSKAFQKKEWRIADEEHYGKAVDWDKYDAYYLNAMDGDEIVGVLDLVISHGVANVKNIIVGHKHRKLGIGRELMQEAERLARKVGAHKMFLDTGEDWEARDFYKSLGYEESGVLRDHSFHKDFVYYSKKIG